MPNTIQHKRSGTPGAVPSAGSLSAGELAVNTADGVVFLKRDNGTVARMPFSASVRSDTVGSTSYIGRAIAGSATSATVWTIRRTILTGAGAVSSTATASSVAWDDRLTATYS